MSNDQSILPTRMPHRQPWEKRYGFTDQEKRILAKSFPWHRAIHRSEQPHLTSPGFLCGRCPPSSANTLTTNSSPLAQNEPLSLADSPLRRYGIGKRSFAFDFRTLTFYEIDRLTSEVLELARHCRREEILNVLGSRYSRETILEAWTEIMQIIKSVPHPENSQPMNTERTKSKVETIYLPTSISSKDLLSAVVTLLSEQPGEDSIHLYIDGYFSPPKLALLQHILDLVQMMEERKKIHPLLRIKARDISSSLTKLLKEESIELLLVFHWPVDFQIETQINDKDLALPSPTLQNLRELLNSYLGRVTAQVEGQPANLCNIALTLLDWGFKGVDFPFLLNPVVKEISDLEKIEGQLTDLAAIYRDRLVVKDYFDFPFFSDPLRRLCQRVRKLRWCEASNGYLAIGADGNLYPCQRFIGLSKFRLGNVLQLTEGNIALLHLESLETFEESCPLCQWKYLCGGRSFCENIEPELRGSLPLRCALRKHLFELAIEVYLSVYVADRRILQSFCKTGPGFLTNLRDGWRLAGTNFLFYWG
jgi:radical SAM protein with 4Fe4S-binding SPASM domain